MTSSSIAHKWLVNLLTIIAPDKLFFSSTDTFLISPSKHILWYSLEAPYASNEYSQYMFLWRSKKKMLYGYFLLSGATNPVHVCGEVL